MAWKADITAKTGVVWFRDIYNSECMRSIMPPYAIGIT